MLRRDAFIGAGLFDESFHRSEDYLLYLKLARRHEIVQHDACVVDYRFHSKSISQDKEEMIKSTMAALDRLEEESPLSVLERKRLRRGRGRWVHMNRPKDTLAYRLQGLYYSFRAMLGVPVESYFRGERTSR